jgi:hypothetical protein
MPFANLKAAEFAGVGGVAPRGQARDANRKLIYPSLGLECERSLLAALK